MNGAGFRGGMAVRRVSVSHIMGGGKPLKLVPPTSAFISGTPERGTSIVSMSVNLVVIKKSGTFTVIYKIYRKVLSNHHKALP